MKAELWLIVAALALIAAFVLCRRQVEYVIKDQEND